MSDLKEIKQIRALLKKEGKTDWVKIEALCEKNGLDDSEFQEKLRVKQKGALLDDFLLDIGYHLRNKMFGDREVVKAKSKEVWERIGSCGVDSGQILLVDPCYVMADGAEKGYDYQDLLKEREKSNHDNSDEIIFSGIAGNGVVVSSGLGDGCYPVYARYETFKDGDVRVAEVKIRFL